MASLMFIVFPLINLFVTFGVFSEVKGRMLYDIISLFAIGFMITICTDIQVNNTRQLQILLVQKSFEKINDSRRFFLKYIFHEVRNPLNSFAIGLEILRKSNLPQEIQETLTMMTSSKEYMADTLNNVLSIQKIEEGKMDLEISHSRFKR